MFCAPYIFLPCVKNCCFIYQYPHLSIFVIALEVEEFWGVWGGGFVNFIFFSCERDKKVEKRQTKYLL